MNTFTIVYLVLVLVLGITFWFRSSIMKWMVWFAQGLFVLSLIGSLFGVFATKPFVYLSERSLKQAGTYAAIQRIDNALPIAKVTTPVTEFMNNIKNLWKPQPTVTITDKVEVKTTQVGVLEAEVYPNLVTVLARLYKTTTMVVSLFGLVLSVYLNFSVAQVSELESLKRKYKELAANQQVVS